jgi:hypothetical protein
MIAFISQVVVLLKQNSALNCQLSFAEHDDTNRSIALPQDEQFWNELFFEARKWGLEMYEQDWLDVQYLTMR